MEVTKKKSHSENHVPKEGGRNTPQLGGGLTKEKTVSLTFPKRGKREETLIIV